jgi:mRNA-degrading endonuclease toxin of MazEF toxin-antitoxin module
MPITDSPLIAVVPVTGTAGVGALYPALTAGTSDLTRTSYALVDHLRSIDKRRIRRLFGQVPSSELAGIDQGLELFLGLGAAP